MQFKSKRPEPPKVGDMLSIVSTQIVEIHHDKPAANQPKQGKLNYLSGPSKKPKKAASPIKRIVEKRQLSIGKYLGNGKLLTTFVMLDPDDVPQEKAAND